MAKVEKEKAAAGAAFEILPEQPILCDMSVPVELMSFEVRLSDVPAA